MTGVKMTSSTEETIAGNTASKQLPVIIVGAGIVGLTLAQSLLQHSIPFEIYERDESLEANTRGWGLTLHWSLNLLKSCIPSSMFSELKNIQVDPEQPLDSDAGKFQLLNLQTGETRFQVPPSERIRINRRKFRILLTQDIDVQWNKAITGFETSPEEGTVTISFHDNTTTTGCILIGTDGSASRTRRFLMGPEISQLHTIPVSLMGVTLRLKPMEIEPLRQIDPLLFNGIDPSTNKFLWYSIQSTPLINGSQDTEAPFFEAQFIFSWIVDSPDQEPPINPEERIQKMKEIAQRYDPRLKRIIENISLDQDSMVIKLSDWPTVKWDNHGGLVTLAGDAAHPMTMYRGEGANHGLADAAMLGELLAQVHRQEKSLKDAVREYEADVQPRGYDAVLRSRRAALDAHDWDKLTEDSPLVSKRARVLP